MVDYLEIADSLIRDVTGSTPAEETVARAAVAQAAATIALIERLDTLIAVFKDAEWITHDCTNRDGDVYHITSLLTE